MRRRSKPHTFEGRLVEAKARLEEMAEQLNPGPKQDILLENIRQKTPQPASTNG